MKDLFHNYITSPIKTTLNSQKFIHLDSVGQTYTEHLSDSMKYSWQSLKSSMYFFAHGIYPEIFEQSGSETIKNLNDTIQNKLNQHKN